MTSIHIIWISFNIHCRVDGCCCHCHSHNNVPFFFLDCSDTNGDGFFDEQELEALFTKEVKSWHLIQYVFTWQWTVFLSDILLLCMQLEKIYDPTNEEDDMLEMEEERLRMREHVMNEVDSTVKGLSMCCRIWSMTCDLRSSLLPSGGFQPRQTGVHGWVPGRYKEKGIPRAR